MTRIFIVTGLATLFALSGCVEPPPEAAFEMSARPGLQQADYDEAAILRVLADQMEAWNSGSVEGFMNGYAQTDDLRFASGGNVRTGWQTTLEAYERGYPDAAAMGTLSFEDLDVTMLSDTYALVFGRWRLERAEDRPGGLFTLIFQHRAEGWRIIHDHTSSE